MSVTLSHCITVDPHIRFRRFDDEGVVVNQSRAEALVINDVGMRLIELSDGARTLEETVALLAGEFDADTDVVTRDVLAFAGVLLEAGLVQLAGTAR